MFENPCRKIYLDSKAAVTVEGAIGFSILFLFIAGIINLSHYLYTVKNTESLVNQAMTRASWQIDLEQPDLSVNDVNKFENAASAIVGQIHDKFASNLVGKAEIESEAGIITSGVWTPDNTLLNSINFDENNIPNEHKNRSILMVVPNVDSTGSRDTRFAYQPIGISVRVKVNLLLPIFGFSTISNRIEAWGYREPTSSLPYPPVLDCMGNPLDKNNPPATCPNCTTGINPETGQCGCPGNQRYVIKNGKHTCECDISQLNCGVDYLVNMASCTCSSITCQAITGRPAMTRLEDNTCGCADTRFTGPDPDTGLPCEPAKCTTDPVTKVITCTPTTCSQKNCNYNNNSTDQSPLGWQEDWCQCRCLGSLDPRECQPGSGYVVDWFQTWWHMQPQNYGICNGDARCICANAIYGQTYWWRGSQLFGDKSGDRQHLPEECQCGAPYSWNQVGGGSHGWCQCPPRNPPPDCNGSKNEGEIAACGTQCGCRHNPALVRNFGEPQLDCEADCITSGKQVAYFDGKTSGMFECTDLQCPSGKRPSAVWDGSSRPLTCVCLPGYKEFNGECVPDCGVEPCT